MELQFFLPVENNNFGSAKIREADKGTEGAVAKEEKEQNQLQQEAQDWEGQQEEAEPCNQLEIPLDLLCRFLFRFLSLK